MQTQTQTQITNDILSNYKKIELELDYLFDKKYRKNHLTVKYLYYGYTKDSIPQNECAKYVLLNTKDHSWKIAYTLSDTITYLQLTQDESNQFKQDISNLIIKERMLTELLIKENQLPKYSFFNKLNFLLKN